MSHFYFHYETLENFRDCCVTALCRDTLLQLEGIAGQIEFSCSLERCVRLTSGEKCGLLAALYHL